MAWWNKKHRRYRKPKRRHTGPAKVFIKDLENTASHTTPAFLLPPKNFWSDFWILRNDRFRFQQELRLLRRSKDSGWVFPRFKSHEQNMIHDCSMVCRHETWKEKWLNQQITAGAFCVLWSIWITSASGRLCRSNSSSGSPDQKLRGPKVLLFFIRAPFKERIIFQAPNLFRIYYPNELPNFQRCQENRMLSFWRAEEINAHPFGRL